MSWRSHIWTGDAPEREREEFVRRHNRPIPASTIPSSGRSGKMRRRSGDGRGLVPAGMVEEGLRYPGHPMVDRAAREARAASEEPRSQSYENKRRALIRSGVRSNRAGEAVMEQNLREAQMQRGERVTPSKFDRPLLAVPPAEPKPQGSAEKARRQRDEGRSLSWSDGLALLKESMAESEVAA